MMLPFKLADVLAAIMKDSPESFMLKNAVCGSREIHQWLRALTVLTEDLGLVPTTRLIANNI